jgi:hypothetical protein
VVVAWQRDSTHRTDEASARKKNAAGEAARPSLPIFSLVFPEFCFSAHSFRLRLVSPLPPFYKDPSFAGDPIGGGGRFLGRPVRSVPTISDPWWEATRIQDAVLVSSSSFQWVF